MALIFTARPETLKSTEMITVEFVLKHRAWDELVHALAERKVNKLAYQGMRELNAYLAKRVGFELFVEEENLKKAVLIIEKRNLFIHNRGIISKAYLVRTSDDSATLGKLLELDSDSFFAEINFLAQSVCEIDQRAAGKFKLDQPYEIMY